MPSFLMLRDVCCCVVCSKNKNMSKLRLFWAFQFVFFGVPWKNTPRQGFFPGNYLSNIKYLVIDLSKKDKLHSGKLTWQAGKSPFSIGNTSSKVAIFQPAMLLYHQGSFLLNKGFIILRISNPCQVTGQTSPRFVHRAGRGGSTFATDSSARK